MPNNNSPGATDRPGDEVFYQGLRIQTYPELHAQVADIVRRRVPVGSSVLDVAAGEGALTLRLLDQGYKVSCTSWNNKVRAPGVEVFSLNLNEEFDPSSVGGRTYACICCIEIIEHLESPLSFLRKVRGLMTEKGCLIVSTPNVESALSRLQVLRHGYPLSFSENEVRGNGHISMLTRHVLDSNFENAGLMVLERHFLPHETVQVRGLRSLAKMALLTSLGLFMQGEHRGAVRLYVLAPKG